MTQVKNFSIGDRVRITRAGHAHHQQIGIIKSIEPFGNSLVVKVYVRGLPSEARFAWHNSTLLSPAKK